MLNFAAATSRLRVEQKARGNLSHISSTTAPPPRAQLSARCVVVGVVVEQQGRDGIYLISRRVRSILSLQNHVEYFERYFFASRLVLVANERLQQWQQHKQYVAKLVVVRLCPCPRLPAPVSTLRLARTRSSSDQLSTSWGMHEGK